MTRFAGNAEAQSKARHKPSVGREALQNLAADIWYTEDTLPDPKEPPIPVGYRILVRPVARKAKIGSIIVPQQTMDDQTYNNAIGRVIALGPIAWTDKGDGEPWCKVGDWIMFGRYAGTRVTYDAVRLVLMNDDDVLAVLPDYRKFESNA